LKIICITENAAWNWAAANEKDFIALSKQECAPLAVSQSVDIVVLKSGIAYVDVERRRYRDYVVECVDVLMKEGTDGDGKVKMPMLVTMIDVRSRTYPPPNELSRTRGMSTPYRDWHYSEAKAPKPGQTYPPVTAVPRRGENRPTYYPSCAEWSEEQETLLAITSLGVMTGQKRYGQFVEQFVGHATKEACRKGLFWWGRQRCVGI